MLKKALFLIPFISFISLLGESCGFGCDVLYWEVCRTGLDYTIVHGTTAPQYISPQEFIRPKYDIGCRIQVSGNFAGSGFLLEALKYEGETKEEKVVPDPVGDNCWLTIREHPQVFEDDLPYMACVEIAKAKYEIEYMHCGLELTASSLGTNATFSASSIIGVEVDKIDQELRTQYITVDEDILLVVEESEGMGCGVKIGFNGRSKCVSGCGAFLKGTIGLIWMLTELNHFETTSIFDPLLASPIVDVKKKEECLILPTTSFAIGLNFDVCCINLQLGYEIRSICGISEFLNFVNDQDFPINNPSGYILAFSGCYLRLGTGF